MSVEINVLINTFTGAEKALFAQIQAVLAANPQFTQGDFDSACIALQAPVSLKGTTTLAAILSRIEEMITEGDFGRDLLTNTDRELLAIKSWLPEEKHPLLREVYMAATEKELTLPQFRAHVATMTGKAGYLTTDDWQEVDMAALAKHINEVELDSLNATETTSEELPLLKAEEEPQIIEVQATVSDVPEVIPTCEKPVGEWDKPRWIAYFSGLRASYPAMAKPLTDLEWAVVNSELTRDEFRISLQWESLHMGDLEGGKMDARQFKRVVAHVRDRARKNNGLEPEHFLALMQEEKLTYPEENRPEPELREAPAPNEEAPTPIEEAPAPIEEAPAPIEEAPAVNEKAFPGFIPLAIPEPAQDAVQLQTLAIGTVFFYENAQWKIRDDKENGSKLCMVVKKSKESAHKKGTQTTLSGLTKVHLSVVKEPNYLCPIPEPQEGAREDNDGLDDKDLFRGSQWTEEERKGLQNSLEGPLKLAKELGIDLGPDTWMVGLSMEELLQKRYEATLYLKALDQRISDVAMQDEDQRKYLEEELYSASSLLHRFQAPTFPAF